MHFLRASSQFNTRMLSSFILRKYLICVCKHVFLFVMNQAVLFIILLMSQYYKKIPEHAPEFFFLLLLATYSVSSIQYMSRTIVTHTQKAASVFTRAEALPDADDVQGIMSRSLERACHLTFNFRSCYALICDFCFQLTIWFVFKVWLAFLID